ncbi:hypothetical protein HanXRQr2_Chr17g0783121 [Helianthus annuus]|uniref:Uncharacterized protein n=1 Tax=Helianthus annuus TaxID=4232 RepID=A0A9K3DGQ1_HELAN|nr:hypothetical protein HanXRQr2_Chr17g0783121 [Helianthus annuus]
MLLFAFLCTEGQRLHEFEKQASSSPSCYHGFFVSPVIGYPIYVWENQNHCSIPSTIHNPHRYILPHVAVNLFSCLHILLSPILSRGHLPPAPDRHITYDLPSNVSIRVCSPNFLYSYNCDFFNFFNLFVLCLYSTRII